MNPLKATLFLATYELPRHLELVTEALLRQSARDSLEVLVCDDGSGPETKKIIEAFKAHASFKVEHLWQEHSGFRKCKILNEALRRAQGETCIFLDGDCIPHRHYIRDHLEAQEPGTFCAGRRVELGEKMSDGLTPEMVEAGYFDHFKLRFLWKAWRGELQFANRMIRFRSPRVRRLLGMQKIADLKGCNYSVARKHLLEIDGFDEAFEGYGREDTDVELRLTNLGLRLKSLKGIALQYHVWHPRRDFTPVNEDLLAETKDSKLIRARKGMSSNRS